MISAKRTRVIADGKIVEGATNVIIRYIEGRDPIFVHVSKDGGVTSDTFILAGIEVVEEKEHYKSEESIPWTQFICKTIKE
jgi:hypothetical protein